MSMSGMAYFKYFEYNRTNEKIEQLYKQGGLQKYLFDFNEQSAFSVDQVMDSFEMGYNQFTINNYRSALAKQCTGKILQTCAGSNRNLKYFKPTSNLTLIDWSPNMASIGMTKTLPSTQYKYVIGDVTKMPFNDDEFDTVIDTFGLQYVINPTRALEEIRRVCKKNGKIILMNEGLSSIVEMHWWEKIKWGYNLLKGGYFSSRNWQKIIKQFDFEIIHQQRKKSGKLYIFVLQNKKDQSQNEKIHQSSQRADFVSAL